MDADVNVRCKASETRKRIERTGAIVAALEPLEGLLVEGLHTELERNVMRLRQLLEKSQDRVGQAVGPRADAKAAHAGRTQRCRVDLPEIVHISVGIGVALEVGQERICRVA